MQALLPCHLPQLDTTCDIPQASTRREFLSSIGSITAPGCWSLNSLFTSGPRQRRHANGRVSKHKTNLLAWRRTAGSAAMQAAWTSLKIRVVACANRIELECEGERRLFNDIIGELKDPSQILWDGLLLHELADAGLHDRTLKRFFFTIRKVPVFIFLSCAMPLYCRDKRQALNSSRICFGALPAASLDAFQCPGY